jgi:hypothetical protein
LKGVFHDSLNRSVGGDLSHVDTIVSIGCLLNIIAVCLGWQTPPKGDSGGQTRQPKRLLYVTHVFTPHNVNQD